MKLIIATAIHNRLLITKAFLKAMRRVENDTGVKTVASVTHDDEECISLCEQYGVEYIRHPNKPVGKKFNAAVTLAKKHNPSHVMILGSDDIPSTSFIEHSLTLKGDIIGILGMYFWGLNNRRAGFLRFGYWKTKTLLGAGKLLSKKVLDACDWQPWPDGANYGMDSKMMGRVKSCLNKQGVIAETYKWRLADKGLFLVDVKYGQHISSLSPLMRRGLTDENDYDVIMRHLPKDEVEYLMWLKDVVIERHKGKNG